MVSRLIKAAVIVLILVAVINWLPDLKRYLEIKRM